MASLGFVFAGERKFYPTSCIFILSNSVCLHLENFLEKANIYFVFEHGRSKE
jgi:hypothetical protein